MTGTMIGAFLPGNSSVALRELPIPEPGIGQVLVKVKASGICGSDIHYIYHEHKGDSAKGTAYLDVVAGHEPCGQIIERRLPAFSGGRPRHRVSHLGLRILP